jgi:hypothetical protein
MATVVVSFGKTDSSLLPEEPLQLYSSAAVSQLEGYEPSSECLLGRWFAFTFVASINLAFGNFRCRGKHLSGN